MPAGKRLAPMLRELVAVLRHFGELSIDFHLGRNGRREEPGQIGGAEHSGLVDHDDGPGVEGEGCGVGVVLGLGGGGSTGVRG